MDMQMKEALLKAGRAADREDKGRAELFEGMVKSEAWKAYIVLLDAVIQDRIDHFTGPSASMDGMVALEYVKGSFNGLMVARNLPSTIIEAMKTSVVTEEDGNE